MSQIKEISAKYLFDDAKKHITVYEGRELESVLFILLEDIFGIRKIQVLSNQIIPWNDVQQRLFEQSIHRLNQYEPVQYVVGYTYFYERKFYVNEHVLIPRPETEELVDLIIKNNTISHPKILDIGTGTGCIAISLAASIRNAEVSALDISSEALKVAASNAVLNQVDVTFSETDFLTEAESITEHFDIIVSNPPYVLQSEKQYMDQNVLAHEPHLALFVEDDQALIYYDALLKFAAANIHLNGHVYAEINEQKGSDLICLASEYGFSDIQILKDNFGKDRILHATKK